MEYDIAKLSPSMSMARLSNNHGSAIIRLAKKTMEQNTEMLSDLMDIAVASAPEGDMPTIDIKI